MEPAAETQGDRGMTKKNTQRRKREQVPVLWTQDETFEVVATMRPTSDERPWSECALFIHLSEGDTTRVVRQRPIA
jgi:hypothetical protein